MQYQKNLILFFAQLIRTCLDMHPQARPTFDVLVRKLQELSPVVADKEDDMVSYTLKSVTSLQ